jgi:hypothetical protein
MAEQIDTLPKGRVIAAQQSQYACSRRRGAQNYFLNKLLDTQCYLVHLQVNGPCC